MSLVPILITAVAIFLAAVSTGVHGILYVDMLTMNGPAGYWEFGPIRFDLTDIAFGCALVGVVALQPGWRAIQEIPYLWLWLLLGVLISISYLVAPINQEHLDFNAPHKVAYQLYRYAWRQILFYPLVMLLLARPDRIRMALLWMMGAGALLALQAIPQGYFGNAGRVAGPLDSGNALGGALAPVLVLCGGFFLAPETGRVRAFAVVSGLLILRAMTFSGSRGALVASAAGIGVMLVPLCMLPIIRKHLAQAAGIGVMLLILIFTVYPTVLLDAPSLARFRGEDGEYSESTLTWRMRERWPHFTEIALANPMLGTGMVNDPALGERGATPHNSYIALAVLYGFPATLLVLLFGFFGVRAGVRMWMTARPPPLQFLVAVAGGALVTVLLHNVIETMFLNTFGARYFWCLLAFCIALERAGSTRAQVPSLAT